MVLSNDESKAKAKKPRAKIFLFLSFALSSISNSLSPSLVMLEKATSSFLLGIASRSDNSNPANLQFFASNPAESYINTPVGFKVLKYFFKAAALKAIKTSDLFPAVLIFSPPYCI